MGLLSLIRILILFLCTSAFAATYEDAAQSVVINSKEFKAKLEIQHTNYHLGDTLEVILTFTNLGDSCQLVPDPDVYGIEFQPQSRPVTFCVRACNGLNDIDTRDSLSFLPTGETVKYKGKMPLTKDYFSISDTAYSISCAIRWSPCVDDLKYLFENGKWKTPFSNQSYNLMNYTSVDYLDGLSFFIVQR